MLWFLAVWALLPSSSARQLTVKEYHNLPQLFHLDDYDRCLSHPDALYCTGTFHLTADQPSYIYNLIEEHSANPFNYNRKRLHRGICVSERCPSNERNSSWRFERCIQRETSSWGLVATLRDHNCEFSTNAPQPPNLSQRTFLAIVAIILCLNFVGTLYDYATGGNGKSKFLSAWSMRSNWRRLTASYEDGDPRLTAFIPVQGFRVFLLLIVMLIHSVQISHSMYAYNPNYIEEMYSHPSSLLIRNSTAAVEAFVIISNFLFGYNMLILAEKVPVGLSQLPQILLNRFLRLAPVHMLVVGFAATWWERWGSGPQWAAAVRAEAAVCRRKLPLHAAFLQNLLQPEDHCLLQTWFLAVDLQLYAVTSILLLTMMQLKWRALPILSALFLLSSALNGVLAYYFNWKPMLFVLTIENIRSVFRGEPSFSRFYTAPWGSLPAALLGLLLAHLHYYIQETGFKINKCKPFVFLYHISIPLHFAVIMSGQYFEQFNNSIFTSIYLGMERPLFALLSSICLLGVTNNIDNVVRRVVSWRGWSAAGRLSLAVLALHWCVNKALVGSRRTLNDLSFFQIGNDVLGTWAWTYLAAIPVTIFVEYPFLRAGMALVSKSNSDKK